MADSVCALLRGVRREEQVRKLCQQLPRESVMWLTVALAPFLLFVLQTWQSNSNIVNYVVTGKRFNFVHEGMERFSPTTICHVTEGMAQVAASHSDANTGSLPWLSGALKGIQPSFVLNFTCAFPAVTNRPWERFIGTFTQILLQLNIIIIMCAILTQH